MSEPLWTGSMRGQFWELLTAAMGQEQELLPKRGDRRLPAISGRS